MFYSYQHLFACDVALRKKIEADVYTTGITLKSSVVVKFVAMSKPNVGPLRHLFNDYDLRVICDLAGHA